MIVNTKYTSSWKSKGLFDGSIRPPAACDNSVSPLIDYLGDKIRLKFNQDCLKQTKIEYFYGQTINN